MYVNMFHIFFLAGCFGQSFKVVSAVHWRDAYLLSCEGVFVCLYVYVTVCVFVCVARFACRKHISICVYLYHHMVVFVYTCN